MNPSAITIYYHPVLNLEPRQPGMLYIRLEPEFNTVTYRGQENGLAS